MLIQLGGWKPQKKKNQNREGAHLSWQRGTCFEPVFHLYYVLNNYYYHIQIYVCI